MEIYENQLPLSLFVIQNKAEVEIEYLRQIGRIPYRGIIRILK